jgi:GntR family transcriptional regulator / MocR family aminotransferase
MRAGDPPPALDQLALAALVESGAYDRHLRAARLRYRARRDALVGALAERLPACEVSGVAAGLHLVLALEPGVDAAALAARAAARGVRVASLDRYRVQGRGAGPGLVLGYGNLADESVERAVTELAAAYHPMSQWRPPTRRSTGSGS